MNLVDYTHPGRVPRLYLPDDRRSPDYYLRLNKLPPGHRYYSIHWALFRYPAWLEGGSAWVQSKAIYEDLQHLAETKGVDVTTLRPVVGSDDPGFDEALAQGLRTFGLRPMVAEVVPRSIATQSTNPESGA
jgi:DNA-binding ferritin-like protein (Dps family)